MAKPKPRGIPVWVWITAGLVIVVGYWWGHRVGSRSSEAELAAAETGIPMQPFTQPPSYASSGSNAGSGFPPNPFPSPWGSNTGGGSGGSSGGSTTAGDKPPVPQTIPGGTPGPTGSGPRPRDF